MLRRTWISHPSFFTIACGRSISTLPCQAPLPRQRCGTSTALLSWESGGRPWEQSSTHELLLSKYPTSSPMAAYSYRIPMDLSSGSPPQHHKPLLTALLLCSLPQFHHIKIHLCSNACLRLAQSQALRKTPPGPGQARLPSTSRQEEKEDRKFYVSLFGSCHTSYGIHQSLRLHKAPTEGGEL